MGILETIGEALSAAWRAVTSLFSSKPVASPTAPCPYAAMSQEQAQKLFDKLKSQPQIPFDYPKDCCYSRANEMCRIMKAQGVPCGKAWNYAHDFPAGSGLHVATPNDPSGSVSWRYH